MRSKGANSQESITFKANTSIYYYAFQYSGATKAK